jgi:hypothetical protein
MARRLLVTLLALLLAVQVVRNAAVTALADLSPDTAARFWESHPASELSLGMVEIGRAAHDRRPVSTAVFALVDDAAARSPLAPEPFLVHGVQYQLAGRTGDAAKGFAAAELRDPRSLPAHYFLADVYYRLKDPRRTLQQIALLARLTPTGASTLGPYLAVYARDRSAWPYLRELFRSEPNIEDASLSALARDPANADVIIALSDPRRRTPESNWVRTLIGSQVAAGQYAKARALWAQTSQAPVPPGLTIYDPGFADAKAPPPFGWELLSSTVGLAERQPGGRLHAIFYGREDGVLARQLLVLSPGTYRMSMAVSGDAPQRRALSWVIRCDKSDRPFASVTLDVAASRPWTFTVPPQCGGQWLELSGRSSDVAQQSELTIANQRLVAETPKG